MALKRTLHDLIALLSRGERYAVLGRIEGIKRAIFKAIVQVGTDGHVEVMAYLNTAPGKRVWKECKASGMPDLDNRHYLTHRAQLFQDVVKVAVEMRSGAGLRGPQSPPGPLGAAEFLLENGFLDRAVTAAVAVLAGALRGEEFALAREAALLLRSALHLLVRPASDPELVAVEVQLLDIEAAHAQLELARQAVRSFDPLRQRPLLERREHAGRLVGTLPEIGDCLSAKAAVFTARVVAKCLNLLGRYAEALVVVRAALARAKGALGAMRSFEMRGNLERLLVGVPMLHVTMNSDDEALSALEEMSTECKSFGVLVTPALKLDLLSLKLIVASRSPESNLLTETCLVATRLRKEHPTVHGGWSRLVFSIASAQLWAGNLEAATEAFASVHEEEVGNDPERLMMAKAMYLFCLGYKGDFKQFEKLLEHFQHLFYKKDKDRFGQLVFRLVRNLGEAAHVEKHPALYLDFMEQVNTLRNDPQYAFKVDLFDLALFVQKRIIDKSKG